MTDLEALAKLASDAPAGAWYVADRFLDGPLLIVKADAAYIAAASPDVVLALTRVALVAKSHHPGGIVGGTCEICAALEALR